MFKGGYGYPYTMKKFFTSEGFYSILKSVTNFTFNTCEVALKEWLGTVIGQRFLKWFTDLIITKFFDTLVEPIVRVAVIRVGYYYDKHEASIIIRKLNEAEEANDEELYMRTLNDALRGSKLPKP